MIFKYSVVERYSRKIIFVTNNFEAAQKIVLNQDESNKHKRLLIIREKV